MNTYGWDLVFVTRGDVVNRSLAEHLQKTPVSVSYTEDNVSVAARFSSIQIVAGGGGKLIYFEMPVETGTISLGDRKWKIDGTEVIVELQLAFIDNADLSHVQDLRFHLAVAGKQVGDTTDGAVTLVKCLPGKGVDSSAASAFSQHVVDCLLANRDQLAYVFAAINLQPPGAGSWLTPRHAQYCYLQGPDKTKAGYLAVLAGLDDDFDPGKCQLLVDPALLNASSDMSMAISSKVFLQHIIAPVLPAAYGHGTTADDFTYDPDDQQVGAIVNCEELDFGGLNTDDGQQIPVKPLIEPDGLRIWVEDSSVLTSIRGLAQLMLSSTIIFSSSSTSPFGYDLSTKTVSLPRDPKPETTANINFSQADAEELIKDSGSPLYVQAYCNLVTGEFAKWGNAMAKDLGSGIGLVDISAWLSTAMSWTACEDWTFTEVGLADALYGHAKLK